MNSELPSATYLQKFQKALEGAISEARSLEEIARWLQAQQQVKSVQLAPYLLKSNPPQRKFMVEFELARGSSVKKVVYIYDLGNYRFQFNKLSDQ